MSSTLDDHIRAALDRIRVSLNGQLEADLTASTSDILRAVADEHRRALVQATEQTAAAIRTEAEQQLNAAREEFARENEYLAREREELHRSSSNEISGLERLLGEVRDELNIARRDLDDLRTSREALERQAEEHREEIQESNERAQNEMARIRLELASANRELEEVRTRLTQSTRLTAAFRTLDEAQSLGDILEQLAHSACQESGRTAVFLVNGGKLRAWRALGFRRDQPAVGSDFELGESDVVGQVVTSGAGQQHRNGDASRLPLFARADGPRDAVALPVQVGGSVIAVLYADAARTDTPEDPEWLNTIDAMTKHAGRVLEAMTVRQAAALWTPPGGVVRS